MDLDHLALVAWAAGIFEGEGCVYSQPQRGGQSPPQARAKMLMTDFEIVEKFHEVVGFGSVRVSKTKNPDHADGLAWRCEGREQVERLRDMFAPFLGKRRMAQFESALAGTTPSGLSWHERREYARQWRESRAA